MAKKVVFYHKDCSDGCCAACVVARKFHGQYLNKEIDFIPVEYTKNLSDIVYGADYKGKEVYIVDFGFDPDMLKNVANKAKSVLMLDHHETMVDMYGMGNEKYLETNLSENCKVIIDQNRSGALMAWDIIHNDDKLRPPPPLVTHVSDADLWRFHYKDTKAYVSSLGMEKRTIENWLNVIDYPEEKNKLMIEQGRLLVKQYDSICERIVDKQKPIKIVIKDEYGIEQAHYGNFVVCSSDLRSRVGEMIYDKNEAFAVMLSDVDKENYTLSLRSSNDPLKAYNVRAIAEYFGGGGHPSASACRVPKEKFEECFIFEEKKIASKLKM